VSDPPSPKTPRVIGGVLAAAVLLASAAGGFIAYRLSHPPPALSALPAPGKPPPPASPGPPPIPATRRAIPDRLPDLAFPGLDGVTHHLADWQGRPLIVNFWATWCEPCRREIPLLKSLRRERVSDGVEIVGIAVDFLDEVRKYARENGIDYPVLVGEHGGEEAVAAFGMEPVLPFTAFADDSGRIVTLKVGELHGDEAAFILDRIRDLEQGRIALPAAREEITSAVRRFGRTRSPGSDAATH
jgi:thiol-disulfide isomerase/thioredoxin